MSWAFAIALTLLLAAGCFFILVGSLGLVKLSDFFKRLHAPTKASTLGVGCVLLASVGYHIIGDSDPQPRELLITAYRPGYREVLHVVDSTLSTTGKIEIRLPAICTPKFRSN